MLLDHSPQLPGHSIKLGLNHARLDLWSPHMDNRKENGNYYIVIYTRLYFGIIVGNNPCIQSNIFVSVPKSTH